MLTSLMVIGLLWLFSIASGMPIGINASVSLIATFSFIPTGCLMTKLSSFPFHFIRFCLFGCFLNIDIILAYVLSLSPYN